MCAEKNFRDLKYCVFKGISEYLLIGITEVHRSTGTSIDWSRYKRFHLCWKAWSSLCKLQEYTLSSQNVVHQITYLTYRVTMVTHKLRLCCKNSPILMSDPSFFCLEETHVLILLDQKYNQILNHHLNYWFWGHFWPQAYFRRYLMNRSTYDKILLGMGSKVWVNSLSCIRTRQGWGKGSGGYFW